MQKDEEERALLRTGSVPNSAVAHQVETISSHRSRIKQITAIILAGFFIVLPLLVTYIVSNAQLSEVTVQNNGEDGPEEIIVKNGGEKISSNAVHKSDDGDAFSRGEGENGFSNRVASTPTRKPSRRRGTWVSQKPTSSPVLRDPNAPMTVSPTFPQIEIPEEVLVSSNSTGESEDPLNETEPLTWPTDDLGHWRKELSAKAEYCRKQSIIRDKLNENERDLLDANCGLGYNFTRLEKDKNKNWTVIFYTSEHNGMTIFTNCPNHMGSCPLSPNCQAFITDNKLQLPRADVVVVYQKDPKRILDVAYNPRTKKPYRALLWREALWQGPNAAFQRQYLDMEIGTHHYAAIPNPQWFIPPSDLLSGRLYTDEPIPFIPVEQRTNFAMSVISHCEAPSMRDYYIRHLIKGLGPGKVHRYGACGTRELPPRPISNAAKLIAKYKFYLSFENTIQEGYVTEKLLETMSIPVLPVYYGDPIVPNITLSPSFIKASDFPTPYKLAEYLLYLDANPEEYNKYHAWRKMKAPFEKKFLKFMSEKIAGPLEVEPYAGLLMKDNGNNELNLQFAQRRAQCCRLCDEEYLKSLKAERMRPIPEAWDEDRINAKFFGGKMLDIRPREGYN